MGKVRGLNNMVVGRKTYFRKLTSYYYRYRIFVWDTFVEDQMEDPTVSIVFGSDKDGSQDGGRKKNCRIFLRTASLPL